MTGHDAFDTGIEPDDTGIAKMLATLPDPGPMPADVTARIMTALSAEAHASDSTGAPSIAAPLVPPALSIEQARNRRHRRALLWSGAAAAAAVAIGGVVTSGGLNELSRTMGGGAATAESVASAPLAASFSAVDSDRDYTAASLAGRAEELLNGQAGGPVATSNPMGTSAAVHACLSGLSIPFDRVSIDLATYEGRPATIAAVQRGLARDAYVVTPDCTGAPSDLIAGPVRIP